VSLPAPSDTSASLVTGASAGIGTEIARELARRGHNLVLVARRKPLLEELATELTSEYGVRAEAVACDLGKPTPRAKLPAQIKQLGLDIEILINNAGFATGGPFVQSAAQRELEQVRVLVEAPVALTSMFAPGMVERRRGAILNVASTAAMQPLPYAAGYSAAKAYVLTFSEALHQELSGDGVTVTALCPGPVETEFWTAADWKVGGSRSFEKAFPSPALVSPRDVARAGVKGLDSGHRVVIPGLPMRAAMLASRYIPHAVKLPVIERAMRRK
jgi:short-subunit dehydrogenase